MNNTAIRVDGLAKRYRIGEHKGRYNTLRDQIANAAAMPFRRLASALRGESALASRSTIWALQGVSFEVEEGEVVGIIGHNGAGKTTLLKILSRITDPTGGRAEIHGRVGSLLEVGTGFHPELTGRENIFLNGAILGMKRAEIEAKFDRIVDFAEVDRFIDTPVKFYSSGMHVRLAFAVAAHLEPEVLLVDEVLAVGDAGFQKKCIRSIRESTEGGRTALVVSHNMGMVRALCERSILLDGGHLIADGPTEEVIARYHKELGSEESAYEASRVRAAQDLHVSQALLRDRRGESVSEVPCGGALRIELAIRCKQGVSIPRPWIGVRIHSWSGDLLSHIGNREAGFELPPIQGTTIVSCELPEQNLLPGDYTAGFVVADIDNKTHDRVDQALSFSVSPTDVFGSGMLPKIRQGRVFWPSEWELKRVDDGAELDSRVPETDLTEG